MVDRRISPSSPTFGSLCRATACSLCLVWSGLWLTAGCFLGWWYQTPANRNPLTSGVQAGETLTRMIHNTVCLYPGCSWCSWNTLSCLKCFGLTHTHTHTIFLFLFFWIQIWQWPASYVSLCLFNSSFCMCFGGVPSCKYEIKLHV